MGPMSVVPPTRTMFFRAYDVNLDTYTDTVARTRTSLLRMSMCLDSYNVLLRQFSLARETIV